MRMKRDVKISGIGTYLPERKVSSEAIDQMLDVKPGSTYKKSGVETRYFVNEETASEMGAYAAKKAIKDARINLSDVDAIISGSGTMEQPIPCNAAFIQKALGLSDSGIPCFDVNTTCLSFVKALDIASGEITLGKYETVLIVSAEISSVGLNWEKPESSILFGDGAAAVVLRRTPDSETSSILCSHMETYSTEAHGSEIRGGGTKIHPRIYSEETKEDFLFDMNGPAIFKRSAQLLPPFMDKMLNESGVSLEDITAIIPHQASGASLRIMRKRLQMKEEQFINVIEKYGNIIASSIPIALHDAIKDKKIQRGDFVMLFGTSAGLSIGGIIFEY